MFNCKSFLELIFCLFHERVSALVLKSLILELVEGHIDAKSFFSRVSFPDLDPQFISYFVKYFPIVQQALCFRKLNIIGLYSSLKNTPVEPGVLAQQIQTLKQQLQMHKIQLQKQLEHRQQPSTSRVVPPTTKVRFNIFCLNSIF